MTDRVFPSSKPTTNGTATTTTKPPPTAAVATKPNFYNPTSRPPPYRHQPYSRRHYPRRSARRLCCCCCLWTTIVLLILLLIAATAGAALYILYHPLRPEFTVPSLRVHRLNLTTATDSSSSHLTAVLNLTVVSKNPNSHISFAYDAFTLTSFSSSSNLFLGNGTLPGFVQEKKNVTTFRNVVVSGSNDLDADSANSLRSDLKKNGGNGAVGIKIQLDTKVTVTVGKVKSKRVGIRVTCDGIKVTVPKGKSPTVAETSGSKCKVDLRIKIWNFTF